MRTTTSAEALRERMQRVASKPRPQAAPRKTSKLHVVQNAASERAVQAAAGAKQKAESARQMATMAKIVAPMARKKATSTIEEGIEDIAASDIPVSSTKSRMQRDLSKSVIRGTPMRNVRRNRVQTLVAWTAWEFGVVPARRISWLKSLIQGS